MNIKNITRSILKPVLAGLKALGKLITLDPRKLESSFTSLEPYMGEALLIAEDIATATGNKTVADALLYAQTKGLPVLESWLHTNDKNAGTILLQLGVQQLQAKFPALSTDDATTAVQNAQRAIRSQTSETEAPAK